MGIDVVPGLVLAAVVVEQFDEDEVLEDVGVIAGMKGVTITEHRGFLRGGRIVSPAGRPLKIAKSPPDQRHSRQERCLQGARRLL
jgi:hypothetical protein